MKRIEEIRTAMNNEYNEVIAKINVCKAQRMRTVTITNLNYAFSTMTKLKDAGYNVIRTTYYRELIVRW